MNRAAVFSLRVLTMALARLFWGVAVGIVSDSHGSEIEVGIDFGGVAVGIVSDSHGSEIEVGFDKV
jgi:hypothetical protein